MKEASTSQHSQDIAMDKITIVKACEAFGVNASGSEHELLDVVLRMEHRRRIQIQQLLEKTEFWGKE